MWGEIVNAPVPAGKMALWGLGGPSIAPRTAQTTLLIDPFFGEGVKKGWERAIPILVPPNSIHSVDAVLASHHHIDHCHEATLCAVLERTDAQLYGSLSCIRKWQNWGFPEDRYTALAAGDAITLGDINVRLFHAEYWEDATALAFSFSHADRVVYYGGDTLLFDGLAAAAPVNWALLSYAKNSPDHPAKLYMDDDDIQRAIEALHADRTLLMHWDLWQGTYIDPAPLIERLGEVGIAAQILHQTDRVVLE